MGPTIRALEQSHAWSQAHLWSIGAPTPDIDGVYLARDLADPSSEVPAAVIERHAQARGLPFGRHAASLVFQRYCHRICGIAVSCALSSAVLPDLTLANVSTSFVDGSPAVVHLHTEAQWTGSTPEELAGAVVDQHLLPVAEAWHAAGRVGLRNLWGNIAAGFARGIRIAAGHIGIEAALSRVKLSGRPVMGA